MNNKCFLMLFILLNSVLASAQTPSDELGNLLQHITSMQATFHQTILNGGKVAQTVDGTMALQRPGKFYWQIIRPYKQTIIADGYYSWIYDVDLQQATKHKLDLNQADSPAMLLSGSIKTLQRFFNVDFLNDCFYLQPKGKDATFQSVALHFDSAKKLDELIMIDKLGQKSVVTFTDMKVNLPINKSLFIFKAKGNVDIVTN